MRTVIIGPPRTGKTTLATNASRVGLLVPVYHTDDLIAGRSWAAQGDAAFNLLVKANNEAQDGFVFEGCLAVRALSRWLKTLPKETFGTPCDQILVCTIPRVAQTPAQMTLGKGILTQFQPLIPALRALGVEIEWER